MAASRRDFLKRSGMALVAGAGGASAHAGEPSSPTAGGELQPFLEIGRQRITGTRALAGNGWRFTVSSEEYPGGKRYRLAVRNTAGTSRMVHAAGVVLPELPPSQNRQWRVFLDSGFSGWCGVKPLEALAPDQYLRPVRQRQPNGSTLVYHQSDMESVVWDASTGACLLAGFLRQRHGRNLIRVIPNASAADIRRIEAVQEFGFEIRPGREQPLDPLVVSSGNNPYRMLETYGGAVASYHGRPFLDPPIVGMMTWYGYRTAIDEQIVLENARLIADLFNGYPQKMRNVMLCDHGWEQDANWGYWEPDRKRFPHGMKWLASQLAKLGMSLGLWCTPFHITKNAPNLRELAPLELLGPDGKAHWKDICVWGQIPGQPRCLATTVLDGGNPAVQKFWRGMMARMKEWGTDYWKLDFFSLWTSANRRRTLGVGDLYSETYRTFRSAAGDGLLNPCSCDTNLQTGYCNSVRIATDIGNAGNWPGTMDQYRHGMGTIAALWFKHRKFWINDPDSIQVAKGCSLAEARVRATVAAMSGGHLMLSEDLRSVDPERVEIIRRLLPVYPNAARSLDLFEHSFPKGYPSLWQLRLQTGFGPATALAVFNMTREPIRFRITPAMLGVGDGRKFVALEWWQYRWLGCFKETFEVDVPAGDVAMLHAQPVKDVPSLLSVSHHYTGGYIVEDVRFDPSSAALTGVLVTKPGLRMVLFGTRAKGWKFASIATFHGVENSLGGWQSEIVTTGTRTPFTMQFERE